MPISRASLKPGSFYYDRKAGLYAYSPDGNGCIWYETREEMKADHGEIGPITSVSEILDY